MLAISTCVLLAFALVAEAVPLATADCSGQTGCLPQNDVDPQARAAAVAERAAGFIYGPSLIGEAAPFPNGTLGNARAEADYAVWQLDRNDIDQRIEADVGAIQATLVANGGLKTLEDYANILYTDAWKNTNPLGTTPGIMTNFTQDLLFSMERLSQNPYPIRLVTKDEALPFALPEDTVKNITTAASLAALQASGSLFFVDHTNQLRYHKTTVDPPRYGAACSAYFYIHPQSKDFLPLAIKTNDGADLIYTPLDTETDWLLAKMMFNVNDFFHSQMSHLVVTHDVSEAVHQAALHTMADDHPVFMLLERMMLQGYSSRVVGEELCFNPGGHWDQLMFVDNVGCRTYVSEVWSTTGAFQASYLKTDFAKRGLIDANGKSPFKHFPFFEDASRIHDAYAGFFKSFVDSYYATDADVAADFEVQNWFVEATANANVQDFPLRGGAGQSAVDKQTLVDVLTHFGFIVSVVHHALNGGDPIGSKATLPFHASALFAPVPTAKGVTDLMPFLPPAANAVHYIGFIGSFNRPFYQTSNRTLKDVFASDDQLARLNAPTAAAADVFLQSMEKLSTEVRARTFDAQGLSQGMPFVYRTIDPGYIPFFSAV
ncbi:lipoxygenase [Mycena filopes]|nr:lipoxygenase [Mycena filopes]